MPSQTQSKSPSRKSDRASRRMTTLSFEQIDRARNRIFTENISASSRVPRPAYVVREADVLGANMPETIKLSKHRSKIYVGLSDVSSGHSSHRSLRSVSRDPSSAATSVNRTSIIDWTDNASDVSAPTGLSGEFSAILPPGSTKANYNHPPPGLETAEIFNFRSVVHKKYGGGASGFGGVGGGGGLRDWTSPRPPPPSSRGGMLNPAAGVPRPPHNTPFPVLTSRRDEFVASTFRKTVAPKKTPLDNCNVVLLGGSITPMAAANRGDSRRRDNNVLGRYHDLHHQHQQHHHRERTTLSFLEEGKKGDVMKMGGGESSSASHDHQAVCADRPATMGAYLGLPRFDLPMIDLKCVESPVANLGDLEEKGIRLVKLRRMKRKKTKDSLVHPNSDRNSNNNNNNSNNNNNNGNGDVGVHQQTYPGIDSFRSEDSITTQRYPNDAKIKNGSSTLKKSNGSNAMSDEPGAARRESSITTPSDVMGKSERNRGAEEEDGVETLQMTNRDSYATPLLPDAEVTFRSNDPSKTPISYREINNASARSTTQKDAADDNANNTTSNNNIPISSNDGIIIISQDVADDNHQNQTNSDNVSHDNNNIILTVQGSDECNKEAKPNQDEALPHAPTENESESRPQQQTNSHDRRFQKRSSSLLTVPDSLCLSERRPPTIDGDDVNEETVDTDVDTGRIAINIPGIPLEMASDDVYQEGETEGSKKIPVEKAKDGRRRSVTVATQTTPQLLPVQ